MPAYVIVHLSTGAPRSLSGSLERLLARHRGKVLPGGGAGSDPGVVTVGVPDMTHANDLAAALRAADGVETAYAKPGEETP